MKRTDKLDVCTNGTASSLPNTENIISASNLETATGDQFTFEGTAENIVVGEVITMESESLVL